MKTKRRKPAAKRGLRGRKVSVKAATDEAQLGDTNWVSGAENLFRPIKKPITLRLDADVLAWFKRQGKGYQTRINLALRGAMMKGRKVGG